MSRGSACIDGMNRARANIIHIIFYSISLYFYALASIDDRDVIRMKSDRMCYGFFHDEILTPTFIDPRYIRVKDFECDDLLLPS